VQTHVAWFFNRFEHGHERRRRQRESIEAPPRRTGDRDQSVASFAEAEFFEDFLRHRRHIGAGAHQGVHRFARIARACRLLAYKCFDDFNACRDCPSNLAGAVDHDAALLLARPPVAQLRRIFYARVLAAGDVLHRHRNTILVTMRRPLHPGQQANMPLGSRRPAAVSRASSPVRGGWPQWPNMPSDR
jgi:hypothetical protein